MWSMVSRKEVDGVNRVRALFILTQLAVGLAHGGQFTVSLEKPPGNVHPLRSNTLEAVLIGNQVYEPLVSIGASGEIQPLLLETWNYEPSMRRFEFKLKGDVRLSNGTPLTSEIVLETFKKIIATNRVQNFSRIRGAAAFSQHRASEVAGFRIQGPRQFSIQLDVAYPRFLADLADPYASVFLEDKRSALPLGTGPYMFKEVSPSGTRVIIGRSPEAKSSSVGIDTIIFTSDRHEIADLYFGKPAIPADDRLVRQEYLDTEVIFLAFNVANPTLADIRTRRYLGSLLTDRMIEESLGPIQYKVAGYIPLGTAGYNPELSFPDRSGPVRRPKAVTVLNYLPPLTPLAEKYCKALRVDGVSCRLKIASVDEMYRAKADGSLQVAFVRQKSTTYSVEYLLSCFTSRSACNIFTSKGAGAEIARELDGLFDQMLRIPAEDKKTLLTLYRKMDASVLGHALVKPIRYGVNKAVWHDRRLRVPALDTLGPFSMKLGNVRIVD